MYSSPSLSRFVRFVPSFNVVFYSSKCSSGFSKNGHYPHKTTNLDQNNTAKHEVADQDCQTGFKKELKSAENKSKGTEHSLGFKGCLGFEKNRNGCSGIKESNGSLGDGGKSNGFQGFKDNSGFRKDYDGSQGFEEMTNGSLGFEKNSNRSNGFGENANRFSWFEENPNYFFSDLGGNDSEKSSGSGCRGFSSSRRLMYEAKLLYKILQRDEPGFDVSEALQQTNLRMTALLVRNVLMMILSSVNKATEFRSAKLGLKFFLWARQQDDYKHNSETYNLLVNIFAVCGELKAMWRLVDEMRELQCPITARTFNILLCSSRKAGMPRKVVEMFIQSKNFNYRPYKHSFNAILHALLNEKHFSLIEWVYEEMLKDGHSPDILTYNIMLYAKHRLGKHNDFNQLLQEMVANGFAPDLHTYNILLNVLGKGDKPDKALDLLNYMREVGCHPQVTHYTALIDGLGRAGNLVACKYIFEEMSKMGCKPDVVCYSVMIIGYAVACELEQAQTLYDEMIHIGQLPNEYTYNAMILGLCNVRRYEEACGMLEVMESRDCYPGFFVYRNLVRQLRKGRKFSQAQEILNEMDKKGRYSHLVTNLKRYRK